MIKRAAAIAALAAAAFFCAGYAQQPAAAELKERLTACGGCHGTTGNSTLPGVPSIAAQPKAFLETQLILFREGVRASPQMQPFVKDLTDKDITAIAAHFAVQRAVASEEPADPALVKRGRMLVQKWNCGSCHMTDYSGRDHMARLAGQREDYLIEAMQAYRDNRRTGDTTMSAILYGVSDGDIRALAHHLAREP